MTVHAPLPRWLLAAWAIRVVLWLGVYGFGWWWYLTGEESNLITLGRLRFFLYVGPVVLPFVFWFHWTWLRKNADRVNWLGIARRKF